MQSELSCFVCGSCKTDDVIYPEAPTGLIWALTRNCNLRCLYCFPDVGSHCQVSVDLKEEELLKIAATIAESNLQIVTLSGGEIFLKKEIFKIVDVFLSKNIAVTLMSNGTVFNEMIALEISSRIRDGKNLRIAFSLDHHDEEINKATRGANVVSRVFSAIDLLVKHGVVPNIATVVNKNNVGHLDSFIDYLYINKNIRCLALQHLGHFGTPAIFDLHRPSLKEEWNLRREKIPQWKNQYPGLDIQYGEFWLYDYERLKRKKRNIMGCRSGIDFAYVDFNGDVFPCTSASQSEFLVGNLLQKDLKELWSFSENLKLYRKLLQTPVENLPECETCELRDRCWGGCRGEALFYTGSILGRPARCPKRTEEKK